jgi:hypothetical protein
MRVTHRYTQTLVAPVIEVFPLLCPVREAEWLPGFKARMIYSDSGLAEPNCVFTTSRAGEPDTVWTITVHDRESGRVEFLRVTPGLVATHIVVQLRNQSDTQSTAEITYVHTALAPAGEEHIERLYGWPEFLRMVQHWETCLNNFLLRL